MSYVEVKQNEFEELLNKKGYKWKVSQEQYAKEIVYLIESDGIMVKVFSSLVEGISRGVGSDAIRVVAWDPVSNYPVSYSEARVYRTEGWRDNLVKRIDGVKERMKNADKCNICGGYLVERINKSTKQTFKGCLNYKNHQKKTNVVGDNKDIKKDIKEDIKSGPNIGNINEVETVNRKKIGNEINNITIDHKQTIEHFPVVKKIDDIDNIDNIVNIANDLKNDGRYFEGIDLVKGVDYNNIVSIDNNMKNYDNKIGKKKLDIGITKLKKIDKKGDFSGLIYNQVVGNEKMLETKGFKWGIYKFNNFNPIQSKVTEFVNSDYNVVIEAKTSTGKTEMGEMFMWKVLEEGKKVIYTSPLKALTREKWDAWNDKFGKNYKLAIVTGDYRLTDKRIKELNEAQIILCTSEMLDHRTRNIASEKSEWLRGAGLLIIDEVQMIGMKDRGDKLEAGLMRFTKINNGCKLVLLSGTMPNSVEISRWIKDLNGKETVLIRSEWRPIKLNMRYVGYDEGQNYYEGKDNLYEEVVQKVKENRKDKILIFVHSKNDGRSIKYMLEKEGYQVEFHNADLDSDERHIIEESFKSRTEDSVRIIIATSTLAYGMNLPARIVIIVGAHRGLEEVSELDIIQMCGRSGRMGIDVEGDAIMVFPLGQMRELRYKVENPGDIISQISNPVIAGFHVIGEIVGRSIKTRNDVYTWYMRTLASKQDMDIDQEYVDDVVDYLINNNAIREIEVEIDGKIEKRLVETELGKAAVYFYLRPDMLKDMMTNFDKIFETGVENNDFIVTWGLSRLRMHYETIVSRNDRNYIENYYKVANSIGQKFGGVNEGQAKIGMAYLNMLKGVKGIEVKDGNKIINPLISNQRSLQQDIERIFQAMAYVDARYSKWGKIEYFSIMGLRMRYGIGSELVSLCRLEGIGGVYAKRLWDVGIKDPIELLTKKPVAISILGTRYFGIINKNKEFFEQLGYNIDQYII